MASLSTSESRYVARAASGSARSALGYRTELCPRNEYDAVSARCLARERGDEAGSEVVDEEEPAGPAPARPTALDEAAPRVVPRAASFRRLAASSNARICASTECVAWRRGAA